VAKGKPKGIFGRKLGINLGILIYFQKSKKNVLRADVTSNVTTQNMEIPK